MTRTIKASEVKPGMTIRFDLSGWDVKGTVGTTKVLPRSVWIYTEKCRVMSLELDSPVTVLAEPQPEEPKAFGARVVADGFPAVRLYDGEDEIDPENPPWRVRIGRDRWQDMLWHELVEDCSVTAIPDQGWTVPADAPEVPERIEEWPEDDDHLREHKWCDRDGYRWTWIVADAQWECRDDITDKETMTAGIPADGPWTRVSDV